MWIFSGITQYNINEIGLIRYFVFVFGGFNFNLISFPVFMLYVISSSPFYCDFLHCIKYCDCYISSVTSVNLKKAGMASRNIVIKTIYVVLNKLCSSLWTSCSWYHVYERIRSIRYQKGKLNIIKRQKMSFSGL